MYWVDSSKHRNDVENLTLLSNVRFPTTFQRLKESTQDVETSENIECITSGFFMGINIIKLA